METAWKENPEQPEMSQLSPCSRDFLLQLRIHPKTHCSGIKGAFVSSMNHFWDTRQNSMLLNWSGREKTTKPMSSASIPRHAGSRWHQKRKKKDSFCQSSCQKSVASVFNRQTWRFFSERCQLQLKETYGQIWHHLPQPKIQMKVVLVSGTSHSPGNRWFYVHAFPRNPKITFFHGAEIPAAFTLFLSAMLQSNVPALCSEVIRQGNL